MTTRTTTPRSVSIFAAVTAVLCDWFSVTPDALRRPGVRPNSPPASGGFSSLG